MSDLVDKLWQRVYSMTQSQSKAQTYGGHISLQPKFDQDLLNLIAQLSNSDKSEIKSTIDKIRGQILVSETTGLVGEKDAEELLALLDEIEKEER